MNYSRRVSSYGSSKCFPIDVTITPAPCFSVSSMSSWLIIALFSSSKWLIGSSKKIKSNGWQRLRIKATRCCCPKESMPAFSLILSGNTDCFEESDNLFFSFYNRSGDSLIIHFQELSIRGKYEALEKRILSECFLISAHSLTDNERIFCSSKLMIP